MDKFETVTARHGEHGVQAILENWERYVGLRPDHHMTLEERWGRFMSSTEMATVAAA